MWVGVVFRMGDRYVDVPVWVIGEVVIVVVMYMWTLYRGGNVVLSVCVWGGLSIIFWGGVRMSGWWRLMME